MWFKNLQLYRLTQPFELSPEALHEKLENDRFRPCGSLEIATFGWVPPLGNRSEQLSHAATGRILLCAKRQEKLLPAGVVREMLDEKVAAIEEEEGRSVRRKERESLRDELLQALLPRAFSRSRIVWAFLAPREGWLMVDSSSAKQADELVSLLRQSLGSFPARPPELNMSPSGLLTAWLNGDEPLGPFTVEDECELKEPGDEGGVVRCRHQDLYADEIRAHLEAGKRVTRLALEWEERLQFVLDEQFALKRLRFSEQFFDEAGDVEDEAARLDADFALMSGELLNLIGSLVTACGGENTDAYGLDS